MTNKFYKENKEEFKTLKQYIPVVSKVHGKNHPEFFQVENNFNSLYEKLTNEQFQDAPLDEEFKNLREITNNYTVPEDVCESYEEVYNLSEKLDKNHK